MKYMLKIRLQEHILLFAEYEEIRDQLLLIGGLSKSHSATGIRIGF